MTRRLDDPRARSAQCNREAHAQQAPRRRRYVWLLLPVVWLAIVQAQAQPPSPAPPYAAADCYLQARERTSLLQEQIEALCVGAPSPTGPIDCFLAARRQLRIPDDDAILLCRCAPNTGPYECFERMRRRTDLTDAQIEHLCSPTLSQGLLANCRPVGGW